MSTAFALKIKSKSGHHIIKSLTPESTIKDLVCELEAITKVSSKSLQVLNGYPPKPFDISNEDITLTACGLKSGETLIIEEKLANKKNESTNASGFNSEQIVKAVSEQEACSGILLKKIVPADNSCLFTSFHFVLNRKIADSSEVAPYFRKLVSETISKDPTTYSEAILGKPVHEYCTWIQDSKSWGGAIELSILANFYGIEIDVLDTLNGIINRFGEDQKYPFRVFLMFDGIHYDPLYMECLDGSDEIKTMFPSSDEEVFEQAQSIAKEAKSSKQFTDTNKFTLKCFDCGILIKGQVEAQQHAKSTKHTNFGEV